MRSKSLLALAALLSPLLAPAVSAADPSAWPTAHGGPENHRSAPSAITPGNVGDLERVWRFRAHGSVTGTPVHADGVVYFADWGGGIHAVNLSDGAKVWSVRQEAGVDSSLAVDGPRVLVADMDGNLTARSRATGEVLWSTPADPVAGTHLYGSPVPHQGRIYQGLASEQTDIGYEGPQDFRGGVACFDAATGKLLWRTYMQPEGGFGVSVWSTPALDPENGLLFVGTGNAYGKPTGPRSDSIVALRMSDGAIAWSHQATPEDGFNARGGQGPDADFGASPLLFEVGGRKLVADGDKAGRFYALDRLTGERVWQVKVDFVEPGVTPAEKEGFLGTAAYADGVVFAPTTARSMVHALDAATGEVLWARELNDQPKLFGDRMFAPTTVTDGLVLQGNAFGTLFALRASTGEVLAEIDVGGDVQGGVSLAGDVVLVPDAGEVMWDAFGNVSAFRVNGTAGAGSLLPSPDDGSEPDGGEEGERPPDVVVSVPPPGNEPETGMFAAPGPGAWLVVTAASLAAAWARARRRGA